MERKFEIIIIMIKKIILSSNIDKEQSWILAFCEVTMGTNTGLLSVPSMNRCRFCSGIEQQMQQSAILLVNLDRDVTKGNTSQ